MNSWYCIYPYKILYWDRTVATLFNACNSPLLVYKPAINLNITGLEHALMESYRPVKKS